MRKHGEATLMERNTQNTNTRKTRSGSLLFLQREQRNAGTKRKGKEKPQRKEARTYSGGQIKKKTKTTSTDSVQEQEQSC